MNFVDYKYNKETGKSLVYMEHLGKTFIGCARLHPDDLDKESELTGCTLAELRATINALKYERKLAKQKSDEAIDFVKACGGYKNFDKESPTAKAMYRQLNRRIKKVNDLTDEINALLQESDNFIGRREFLLNSIRNKKNMSKEDK